MSLSKKLALVSVLISVLIIYITIYQNRTQNPRPVINPVEQLGGYGLTLCNLNEETYQNFVVNLEENEMFDYKLKFINRSGKDSTFALLIYVDFQQIEYITDISNEKKLVQNFDVKNEQHIFIPVKFQTQTLAPGNHVITFSVLAGSDKHAGNMKISVDSYGITGRYNLYIGKERELVNNKPKLEGRTETFKANNFSGFLINQDFEQLDRYKIPNYLIKAKAREKIKFALRAGGEDSEEYVAWITMDWKQVNIQDITNYWYFKLPRDKIAYKEIEITAPSEKGDYEITGFLAANPWKNLNDGVPQAINTTSSYRFTLRVE
ncbi:hypothetical protein [Paenibacillus tyrfis]|uniref:hypothetical protein n=1 Tax=Paenibacillus tyrfis TaxID=1501230 RepID=UPI00117F36C5|nr:hypothetical protein [Paenibacillus tyrfis]